MSNIALLKTENILDQVDGKKINHKGADFYHSTFPTIPLLHPINKGVVCLTLNVNVEKELLFLCKIFGSPFLTVEVGELT